MKIAYLRGYYGYKNFGDEIILFGIIPYLLKNYKLKKLIIEVGNKNWIKKWVSQNNILDSKLKKKIHFVEIKQHRWKRLTHLINFLGLGKYKNVFKFFGGGEVLSDERPFPHDGWNIRLLFNKNIRKGNFILLGGIGTPKTYRSKILYKLLLPQAKEIILRDSLSQTISQKIIYGNNGIHQNSKGPKIKLYEDFSLQVLRKFKTTKKKNGSQILVNINSGSFSAQNIQAIKKFCKAYPNHQIIYFPCDMNDDIHYFQAFKKEIPSLKLYDWTKHSLQETLELFQNTKAGIGSRLHFLLPLKFFGKKFQSISNMEKVKKMLKNK